MSSSLTRKALDLFNDDFNTKKGLNIGYYIAIIDRSLL